MESTKESIRNTISFDTLATLFQEEAGSLLSKEVINEILINEKQIWQCAERLQLPHPKYIGNNMRRYCKDRLREKQPFYRFYLFLCFMMELSTLVLLFGALIVLIRFILPTCPKPLTDLPVFYLLLVPGSFLFFRTQGKKHLRLSLISFSYVSNEKDVSDTIENIEDCFYLQKKHDRRAILCIMLPVCFLLIAVYYYFGLAQYTKLDFLTIIEIYIDVEILFGLHNILYSCHAIPFFTIGGNMLSGHTKEEIAKDCAHYENLCYVQILSQTGQSLLENPTSDEEAMLIQNTKASLKARLISTRIYVLLGFVLFLLLDGICIATLITRFSIPLLLFAIVLSVVLLLLLIAFLSANRVIKDL